LGEFFYCDGLELANCKLDRDDFKKMIVQTLQAVNLIEVTLFVKVILQKLQI
jgi:hypothetical protein